MVSKDRGVTWEIGDTNRVFSSVYAIAGMLKEKIETSWLSDTLVEDPKEMIQIMNGGTVDIVQQLIKAGTPYKSPFAIKQTPEVVTFERDTIVSYVVGFHYGTNGQRYADMLAVKMIGF